MGSTGGWAGQVYDPTTDTFGASTPTDVFNPVVKPMAGKLSVGAPQASGAVGGTMSTPDGNFRSFSDLPGLPPGAVPVDPTKPGTPTGSVWVPGQNGGPAYTIPENSPDNPFNTNPQLSGNPGDPLQSETGMFPGITNTPPPPPPATTVGGAPAGTVAPPTGSRTDLAGKGIDPTTGLPYPTTNPVDPTKPQVSQAWIDKLTADGWAQGADGKWSYTGDDPRFKGDTGHIVGNEFINDTYGGDLNLETGTYTGPSLTSKPVDPKNPNPPGGNPGSVTTPILTGGKGPQDTGAILGAGLDPIIFKPGGDPGSNKIVSTISPELTNTELNYLGANVGQGATAAKGYEEGSLSAGTDPLLASQGNFLAGGDPTTASQQTLQDAAQSGLTTDVMSHANTEAAKQTTQDMIQSGLITATPDSISSAMKNGLLTPPPDAMKQAADTGLPIDQTPAWQAMVDATQRNIQRNQANMREQFAFKGNLASSPFGQSMTDYMTQTTKDQNAALIGAQTTAAENAANRRLRAGEDIAGLSESAAGRRVQAGEDVLGQEESAAQRRVHGTDQIVSQEGQAAQNRLSAATDLQSAANTMAQYFQGLDQSQVDRVYQEFLRTRPEYSPLLNAIFSAATTFPETLSDKYGVGATGAIISGVGNTASGIADIINANKKSDVSSKGA